MPPYLIAVTGNPDGFPGYSTFWRTASHVGIDRADCLVVDASQPLAILEQELMSSGALSALCLGGEAFGFLSGIRRSIVSCRGYLFDRDDCVPITIREREQIGLYRTTRKKGSETLHTKGDPKFGMVSRQRVLDLGATLRWIIPTLSPRAIEESRFKTLPALKADLQRLQRSLDSSFRPLQFPYDELPFQSIGTDGIIAFDIETQGIGGPIDRIGVATGAGVWTSRWTANTKACFQAILDDNPTLLVGHNLAFDIPRLEAAGVQFPDTALFDTMLAAHMLQPDLYKGLEKVASLYLDLRPWKHLSSTDEPRYNAIDVSVTLLLAERMLNLLSETGMYGHFSRVVMPALRTLMNMTRRGLKVDRIHLGGWQASLSRSLETHLAEWQAIHPTIDPHSPSQLKKLFYKDMGLPEQFERTKEGPRVTTDEAALRALRTRAPETIDTLLAVRKTSKLRSVYATMELGRGGCVHPSYLPVSKDTDSGAAATGRLASSEPNIQNQPEEARRLFIPSEDDFHFIEADYSQIELRIAAARSGDVALIEALKTGDVHATTMDRVGCDRTRAKNLLYGSMYGAGPRKLATVLRQHGQAISESECADLQARLSLAYPMLWAWRQRVVSEGTTLGYLTNAFGRRRYFYHRWRDHDGTQHSGDVPEMLAYLPQSDAADILWTRLPALEAFAGEWNGHLVTTVHDSFLLEFPTENLDRDLFRSLRSVLECEFSNIAPGFRVPVNLKMGANWGEMSVLVA
jgi:DNA polymerase-1